MLVWPRRRIVRCQGISACAKSCVEAAAAAGRMISSRRFRSISSFAPSFRQLARVVALLQRVAEIAYVVVNADLRRVVAPDRRRLQFAKEDLLRFLRRRFV